MPQIAFIRPFGELDFTCELRLQPDAVRQLVAREAVRPRTGSPNDGQFAEWTVGSAQRLERAEKFFDGFIGEATPHSASELQSLFRIIVADQQSADTDAGGSDRDVASDDEGLLQAALVFEPRTGTFARFII